MEELVNRYRALKLSLRYGLAIILGLAPAVFAYIEEAPVLQDEVDQKSNTLVSKKADFERHRAKANNLPELEERLAFTQGQLEEARKRLPDDFFIEDFLAKLSTFASENLALMTQFVPAEKPEAVGGAYKYEELVINVNFEGSFEHVVSFLDEISHLQTMVHIRDINMKGVSESTIKSEDTKESTTNALAVNDNIKTDKNSAAIAIRAKSIVSGSAKVAIFRSSKSVANALELPDPPPAGETKAPAAKSGEEG